MNSFVQNSRDLFIIVGRVTTTRAPFIGLADMWPFTVFSSARGRLTPRWFREKFQQKKTPALAGVCFRNHTLTENEVSVSQTGEVQVI